MSTRVKEAAAGRVLMGQAGRGAGRQPARRRRQLDRAEAGNGRRRHPSPSTMEAAARRRGSPRNRYGVAKVRWPLRAVWIAAEADAPRPARRTRLARPPHLLCIYRAAQPAQPGDAGMSTLPRSATSMYLRIRAALAHASAALRCG